MRDPGQRGVTVVADRVVAKIAARVAAEDHGLTGTPDASAKVSGRVATVRLGLAVRYPAPLPQVAARVRDRVRRRVRALTGVSVESVDIDVERLDHVPDVAPDVAPGPREEPARLAGGRR